MGERLAIDCTPNEATAPCADPLRRCVNGALDDRDSILAEAPMHFSKVLRPLGNRRSTILGLHPSMWVVRTVGVAANVAGGGKS